MQTIFFLARSLDYGGAARRLTLLADGLPRDRFRARVCVLGGPSPWAEQLRAAGVRVDELGWKRALEASPLLTLRRLLAEEPPALVHAWGRAAVRAAATVGGRRLLRRLLVSAALPPAGRLSWPDRWLLRRAAGVAAFGEAEAERYRRLGVPADRVAVVPPGVSPFPEGEAAEVSGRVLLGVGPLEAPKGFRDAVWALDILHFLYDDVRLVLVGGGADRPHVAEFARAIGAGRRVDVVGPVPDVGPWLRRAEVVWVPSRVGGGVQAALEAMAAGRPVVAARLPALAEVVADGETGLFFRPGDKADLARQTRRLLDDPARGRAMGEAGRRRAAEQFPADRMAERFADLYDSLTKSAAAP
jgi:glycosyltransferase involved in cell wall biosynthesis